MMAAVKNHHRGGRPRKNRENDLVLVVEVYRKGRSLLWIERELGIPVPTAWRWLKAAGVKTRATSTKGLRCVDCGVKCEPARRCELHRRVRTAELNRDVQRKRKGIPESRWLA